MVISGLARRSVVLCALTLFLVAGFGYFIGAMFPFKVESAPNPGTCLPIEKGGTGCDAAALKSYLGLGNIAAKNILDLHPVNSIYITTTNTNPGTFLGGTWAQYGQGRTMVGVGSNGTTNYTTPGATGGADSVTLTVAQMPSHTHTQNAHSHTVQVDAIAFAGSAGGNFWGLGAYSAWQNASMARLTSTTATNQNTGGGGSHENRMPYITVYFWRRTA